MKYAEAEKQMWLEDWRASRQSAWAYAKANGLNPQTFISWTKAQAAEHRPERFVEVTVAAQAGLSAAAELPPEIVIEKGAVKIHIPLDPGGASLRAMLSWLGQAL